jgi:hypothetical protein
MKKNKQKLVLQLDDIICDICGNSCKKKVDIESAKLFAHWGYDSLKDGDVYDIDICENCFDKTLAFLMKIRSHVNTRDDSSDTLTPISNQIAT